MRSMKYNVITLMIAKQSATKQKLQRFYAGPPTSSRVHVEANDKLVNATSENAKLVLQMCDYP